MKQWRSEDRGSTVGLRSNNLLVLRVLQHPLLANDGAVCYAALDGRARRICSQTAVFTLQSLDPTTFRWSPSHWLWRCCCWKAVKGDRSISPFFSISLIFSLSAILLWRLPSWPLLLSFNISPRRCNHDVCLPHADLQTLRLNLLVLWASHRPCRLRFPLSHLKKVLLLVLFEKAKIFHLWFHAWKQQKWKTSKGVNAVL